MNQKSILHTTILILFALVFNARLFAIEPPSGLMTDLIEHTEVVYIDGYRSNLTLSEATEIVENFQTATINSTHPKFTWILTDTKYNVTQEAYQILLGTDPEQIKNHSSNVWDSGKMESRNSTSVSYTGKPLNPNTIYYWKVRAWTNHGEISDYSEIKAFLTGSELKEHGTSRYPLQKEKEFPVTIQKNIEGNLFADFGKDAFGQLSLTLFNPSTEDDSVLIYIGESVINRQVARNPGGTIRYAQYNLILKQGWHTYRIINFPDKRNTGANAIKMPDYIGEVFPFRYVEIKGYSQNIEKHQLLRESVHYLFNDLASDFYCSDTILNQVWDICKYSIKATSFTGLYVDGDRERIPYEADALINQLGHYAVDREFSMARNTHEYLIFNPTWPTEWHLQSVLMAWYDYMYTGDISSAETYYNDLKAKTLYMLSDDKTGLISTKAKNQNPAFLESIHLKNGKLKDIVDWPHTGILGLGKHEGGETDGYKFGKVNTVVNAFYYRALTIMGEFAKELKKSGDVTFFREEAARVKKSFNKYLLNKKTGIYTDGINIKHMSLHANFFPLAFGLVPEKNINKVLDFIRSRGMACSVYGAQFLLDALYDAGDNEYAYQLLSSTDERSWYNMIRVGSTITMEAWDMKYKPNSDWNHAWGAAPANTIPRKLFGIGPLELGFSTFSLKPQLYGLDQAKITVPSIKGDISCSWEKYKDTVRYSISVPVNSNAEFILPNFVEKKSTIFSNGQPIEIINGEDKFVYLLGSGSYEIEATFKE